MSKRPAWLADHRSVSPDAIHEARVKLGLEPAARKQPSTRRPSPRHRPEPAPDARLLAGLFMVEYSDQQSRRDAAMVGGCVVARGVQVIEFEDTGTMLVKAPSVHAGAEQF